jgi:hypothetical protein
MERERVMWVGKSAQEVIEIAYRHQEKILAILGFARLAIDGVETDEGRKNVLVVYLDEEMTEDQMAEAVTEIEEVPVIYRPVSEAPIRKKR